MRHRYRRGEINRVGGFALSPRCPRGKNNRVGVLLVWKSYAPDNCDLQKSCEHANPYDGILKDILADTRMHKDAAEEKVTEMGF